MESLHTQISTANLTVNDEVLPWLEKLDELGKLSIGWPGKEHLLAASFVWVPQKLPTGTTTSIVSSRLGRQVDSLDAIFRVLRSALAQLDPHRQSMLTVEGTTTHDFVARGCELFGIPLIKVCTPSPRTSLLNWTKATLRAVEDNQADARCFVSNPVDSATSQPLRDEIEVLASDQLLVLNVRPDGNLHRLVLSRLRTLTPARAFIAMGHEQLVSKEMSAELMDSGAIGWLLFDHANQIVACPMDTAAPQPIAEIHDVSCIVNQEKYLTHCTRRTHGAWPDQHDEDHWDELILGEPTRDRSNFATLMRIVRMQRLLASGESIRTSTPVVSLTAAPIGELSSMRTYRSHRGRWDFEPYGVAIDRQILLELGVREVIYGDNSVWEELPSSDRPFFQMLGEAENAIDWSAEKEWRVLGDIDLSKVPPDKALVFVPTRFEAEQIASVSRWPVIVSK